MTDPQVIFGNPPSKSNSYRIITIHGHGSLCKTTALKNYENSFYIQCNKYRNKNIEGYFELYIDVFYPSQRSDLDNSLKSVLDCLGKVKAFTNDNKCTKIVASKYLDKANPRVEFELIEVK
jgi:Holliday junction resolvase RusA-like endonuclease